MWWRVHVNNADQWRNNSKIENRFLIFKNSERSCPIRGVTNDVFGVSYRSATNKFIEQTVVPEWLGEKRVIGSLPDVVRDNFLDNFTVHALTDKLKQALECTNTHILFFQLKLTDYMQPCDAFPIENLKEALSARW